MTHWYTADLHFGHENVIRFCKRPFSTAAEMDATIIANLCELVGPEDDLWILGDFAWGKRSNDAEWLQGIFEQLPGRRRHLIIGNHDLEATQALPWDSVRHLKELRDGPQNQLHTLCHYPMITWNHARRHALQMFGHVHENWKGSRNSVNVGVDVWNFKPVRFEDVERRARELPVNAHWGDVEPRTRPESM